MTAMLSCNGMYVATAHLARRSNTTTETAMRKKYLRMELVDCDNSLVLKSNTLKRLSCVMCRLDAVSSLKESRPPRMGIGQRAPAVASISASTALHRSQTVGYDLSSPTWVE